MKKILSMALIVALCMSVSLNVFAAGFNAGVEITEGDGVITVTVQHSEVLVSRQPTLKVPCDFAAAQVTFNGQVLDSVVEEGYVCFAVAAGGDYVITEVEAPDTPDTPDQPTTPETPQRPDRPVKPVGPEKEEPSEEEPQPAELPFTDLTEADWFHGDVAWVYENSLMNGLTSTTFGPGAATSRGMIVTILWRLEGMPTAGACPFADVTAGSYYEQAIAWAAENLIVTGRWVEHPTHGNQVVAENVERHMPTTESDIISYLSSGIIKGVGQATALVLVQRFGDLIRGRRSTPHRMTDSFMTPTLNATAGDLSLVLPKRILDGIIEMIYALDKIAPGTANDDTLLYGVEVKFYNMEVAVDSNLESCHKGLYIIGDGSGITHSLSHASASGVHVARNLAEQI
jgi:hypothetical protein